MSGMGTCTLGILSDIHYASAAEQARGDDFEHRGITNPLARVFARFWRHFVWLREPLAQNHLLDLFIERGAAFDYVIANGDYSCNSAFVGLSDDAAYQSARECLQKLRQRFGANLRAIYGDHELGKTATFGTHGGMRLASWYRTRDELGLPPFWQVEIGRYTLLGFAATLVALPVFEAEILPEERAEWERLRAEHLAEIRYAFAALPHGQRVLLFCHDPTALPFLWREEAIRARLPQIEHTIIGHLHTNLILWSSRLLAGMPPIRFLSHSARRMSTALHEARHWRPFHVRLCPALAGIELLKDGGYCTIGLDPEARRPASFCIHRIPRS
jgi:hypothetical protein